MGSSILARISYLLFGTFLLLSLAIVSSEADSRVKRQEDGEGDPAPALGEPVAEDENSTPATDEPKPEEAQVDIIASDEWIQNSIRRINELRSKHGACPLSLDKKLCQISQKRANEIIDTGKISTAENTGETVFSSQAKSDGAPQANEAIDKWYEQGKKYNFIVGKPMEPDDEIGSLAQLLWKDSSNVCITYVKSASKSKADEFSIAVVANFFPIGNVDGEFVKNVRPLGEDDDDAPVSNYTPRKISSPKCPTAKVQGSKKWLQNILDAHNILRKLHGVPPLILNNDLSEISQSWANKMAVTNAFDHNVDCLKAAEIGENMYFSASSVPNEEPGNGTRAMEAWYEEINNYDYETTESLNGQEILHFTQLVWAETKEMGAAFALSKIPKRGFYSTYVIVNYTPRGNFGNFTKNVPKPKCKNINIADIKLPLYFPEKDAPTGPEAKPSGSTKAGGWLEFNGLTFVVAVFALIVHLNSTY